MLRRLPVYLLLDCSESMAGPAIESVNHGVNALVKELRGNPGALETAYLSVITFSREAKQVIPLTELFKFQPPPLSVRPGTAMGGALKLLIDCLNKEVTKTTAKMKGDYKPLVFILTDGQPTDKWEEYADILKTSKNPGVANIYAIGCGPDVDLQVLHRITDIVLLMNELTPEALKKCFLWLTASIKSASAKIPMKTDDGPLKMPPLPPEVMEVAMDFIINRKKTKARQVFLHALCSRDKLPYLMRYILDDEDGRYHAVASHKLENIEEGDEIYLPPIDGSLISGCSRCPYCENSGCIFCSCGTTSCDSGRNSMPQCPGCNKKVRIIYDDSPFEIKQSQG